MPAMRRLSQLDIVLVLLVYIPLIAAIYVAADRYSAEARNRAVGIAVDGGDLFDLLATGDMPADRLLPGLAARRCLVALTEDTVTTLFDAGRLAISAAPGGCTLTTPDEALAKRLRAQLGSKLAGPVTMSRAGAGWAVTAPAPRPLLESLGVGLPPERVAALGRKVPIVARLKTYDGVTAEAIEYAVAAAARQRARVVVFDGEEILGYPTLIKRTAAALQRHGILYGSVEFANQRGDAALGRALGGELVRVHSITAGEMAIMDPGELVERFSRAVRERNIRLCYLRAYSGSRATPERLLADIDSLGGSLRGAHLTVLAPHAIPSFSEDTWLRLVVALAAVAAAVLLVAAIYPLGELAKGLLFVVGAAGCLGLVAATGLGAKAVALLGAVAFPSLSLVLLGRSLELHQARNLRPVDLVARCGGLLLAVSVISAGGALVTVAMLSDRLYLAKVDAFAGIKLAHLLPLLIVAVVATGRLYADTMSPRQWWAMARSRLGALGSRPVLIWQVVLGLLGVVALALVVARTGNDPGVGVSPLELKFRSLLEAWLPARPRTKEFLLGHPALMLAAAMALTGRRRWLVPALVVGGIGQVSLVNTFCHIHTPIGLSVTRAVTGLVSGMVVGAVVVVIWLALARRWSKLPAPSQEEPEG